MTTNINNMSKSTASETSGTLTRLLKRTRKFVANETVDAARLDELRRTFSSLIASGELILHGDVGESKWCVSDTSDVKAKWSRFLRKRHEEYLSQLSDALRIGRKSALRTFCGVVASSPRRIDGAKDDSARVLDERLLYKLVDALASPTDENQRFVSTEESMINLLDKEFVKPHRDVQYFIMLAVRKLASDIYAQAQKEDSVAPDNDGARAENLLRILLRIELAGYDDDLENADVFLVPPPTSGSTFGTQSDEADGEDGVDEDLSQSHDDSDDDTSDDDSKVIEKNQASMISRQTLSPNRPTWQQVSKHRRALQESWLAVLKIPTLPTKALKKALQHLPSSVLPIVSAPLRFADFFTESYEVGGVTSLLALDGLFILMTEHGLEYPKFYASLYCLVTPRNFYAKHRTRFFRLLTNCLTKTDMLPAYCVAAFCKRLARCALTCPPSGALFVLALVSNLLRRHTECACLIHRGKRVREGNEIKDSFNADADDPEQSRALESSLWELAALERHFHPAVVALAKSVGAESDQTPYHNMNDFLMHTYKSLFDTERKHGDAQKKKRKAVPLAFTKPKRLFSESDVFCDVFAFGP